MKTLREHLNLDPKAIDKSILDLIIEKLPEENRMAIERHFLNNLPRQTIATQLGWSLSKVNQKITRGITLLKFHIDPGYFEVVKKEPNAVSGNGSAQP